MRENKVKIPYKKGLGVYDLELLDKMDVSFDHIETVKKIFSKSLNNKISSFEVNNWIGLCLPFGLLIIILGAVLLSGALSVVLIFFGVFVMFVYPLYLCTKLKTMRTTIKNTVDKIKTRTNGALQVTPKYKKKIKRNKLGVSSFRVLSYFLVEKGSEKQSRRKRSVGEKEVFKQKVDMQPEAPRKDSEQAHMKDYFETNEGEGGFNEFARRKDTEAFGEEQDEFGKLVAQNDHEKGGVNVQMVQMVNA